MTIRELIELAQLDAYGLLDDAERDAFDAAFAVAAPEVQAALREEQSRLVRDPLLLADADPPPALKDEVLADFGAARLRESVLSRVHREIALQKPTAPARVAASNDADDDLLEPIPFIASRQVARSWRTIGVTAAAASVALGVTTIYLQSKVIEVSGLKAQEIVNNDLGQYGGPIGDLLFKRDTRLVIFDPVASNFRGAASLFFSDSKNLDAARLYWTNIPQVDGVEYHVVVIGRDELMTDLGVLPRSGLRSMQLALNPATADRVAIIEVRQGEAVSSGRAVLMSGSLFA